MRRIDDGQKALTVSGLAKKYETLGMKAKLSIAAAFAHHPKLLILDEPPETGEMNLRHPLVGLVSIPVSLLPFGISFAVSVNIHKNKEFC